MSPPYWLIWLNERIGDVFRHARRKPALRVIEGGRK
jgi:hypothetical protein